MTSNYEELVLDDGMNLKDVPMQHRTKELCWLAIQREGYAISFVPKELRTEEMYLNILDRGYYGEILEFIPEDELTEAICKAAVKHRPSIIDKVPKKMLTEEMCINALDETNWDDLEYIWKLIPIEMRKGNVFQCMVQRGYFSSEEDCIM